MLIGVSLVLFNRCCCIELEFLPFWRDAHDTPAHVALFVIILRTPFDFPSCFEPLRWQIQVFWGAGWLYNVFHNPE